MKHLYLILALFLASISLHAQSWSIVRGDKHPVFVGPSVTYINSFNGWGGIPDPRVYDLSFDSAFLVSGTDSVFYFRKEVDPFHNTTLCGLGGIKINLFSSGWMGNKLIRKGSGEELLFNQSGDTIILFPRAGTGQTWTIYRYANGNYIEATVSQIQSQTILGVTDSLKIINLQAKNATGNILTNNLWTGRQIKLSRNFGPAYIFGAWRFPVDTVSVNLVGEQKGALGNTILTGEEIFDFDVADEFHYHDQMHPIPFGWGFIRQTKLKVLSKNIQQGVLTYVMSREGRNSIPQQNPVTNYYLYSDTVSVAYNLNNLNAYSYADMYADTVTSFNYIPNGSGAFNGRIYTMQSGPYTGGGTSGLFGFNGRKTKIEVGPFLQIPSLSPACGVFLIDLTGPSKLFVEGVGLVSHIQYGTLNIIHSFNLVYYKKGIETFGTPIVLGETNIHQFIRPIVNLFPQPARSGQLIQSIGIEQSGPIRLLLFDANGRQICSLPSEEGSETSWKLPELSSGIYFYLLQNQNQSQIARGKLMIGQD